MTTAPAMIATTGSEEDHHAQLVGRFMLPDATEHPCEVVKLSPDGAVFLTGITPPAGLAIVAYIDEIGRLEAVTGEAVEEGFAVTFQIGSARRERIASRIRSLLGSLPDGEDDARRSLPSHETSASTSQIILPDGRIYPCEVTDVSVSGAAVRTEVMPALGTIVLIGRMRGRVVRYLDSGVMIEFTRPRDSFPSPLR